MKLLIEVLISLVIFMVLFAMIGFWALPAGCVVGLIWGMMEKPKDK